MSKFLVDVILPYHEVHLLGGPSGAGKTRWLMQQLLLWELGEDFLGYHSHPAPWVYVAGDRSLESVERTLGGMGIDYRKINVIPAWDKNMGLCEIMDSIKHSKAKLAVWESFGSFVEEPGRSKQVKAFINRMCGFCRDADTTILGVMESPKMKPYERYENPRQRISGAAGWGHFSETVLLVEPDDPDNIDSVPYRTLTCCPRNGPEQHIPLCFDPMGRLLPMQREQAEDVAKTFKKRRK